VIGDRQLDETAITALDPTFARAPLYLSELIGHLTPLTPDLTRVSRSIASRVPGLRLARMRRTGQARSYWLISKWH